MLKIIDNIKNINNCYDCLKCQMPVDINIEYLNSKYLMSLWNTELQSRFHSVSVLKTHCLTDNNSNQMTNLYIKKNLYKISLIIKRKMCGWKNTPKEQKTLNGVL